MAISKVSINDNSKQKIDELMKLKNFTKRSDYLRFLVNKEYDLYISSNIIGAVNEQFIKKNSP